MNFKNHDPYTTWKLFRQILNSNRIVLVTLILVQIISGICPVTVNYLMSKLIDSIAAAKNLDSRFQNFDINHIFILVLACSTLLLLDEVLSIIHSFFSSYFSDYTYQQIKFLLLQKISLHPTYHFFEDSKTSDLVALSKKNIQNVSNYINIISCFLRGLFLLVPVLISVYTLKWWFPFILITTFTPLIYFRVQLQKKIWNITTNFSHIFTKMDIYEECLTSNRYSKDIRMYKMQSRLLDVWNSCFFSFFNIINHMKKFGAIVVFLLAVISGTGVGICFFHVANNVVVGHFTLGDLSFVFGIILQLKGSMFNIIYGGLELIQANLSLKPLLEILNVEEPKIELSTNDISHKSDSIISFQNITFHYPGSNKVVISNMTLDIKNGSSVAIVGENGSGKTTIAKLICRFYEPSSGAILWKSKNVKTIDFQEYRAKISLLFQDFAQFPLSVRENIDVREQFLNDQQIYELLMQVELYPFLHDKLEKTLSKIVKEGVELSGGQWQRLAITRILADLVQNDAVELLIFDEPTSALDPNSEHHVIELIHGIIKQKTSIIISHRLAITRYVDRILIVEDGRIVEDGHHSNLMKLKGRYYQMFTKQASYYT